MDASTQSALHSRAEALAQEFAGQATAVEELNALLRAMMKSGLERMLDSEMKVRHKGQAFKLA